MFKYSPPQKNSFSPFLDLRARRALEQYIRKLKLSFCNKLQFYIQGNSPSSASSPPTTRSPFELPHLLLTKLILRWLWRAFKSGFSGSARRLGNSLMDCGSSGGFIAFTRSLSGQQTCPDRHSWRRIRSFSTSGGFPLYLRTMPKRESQWWNRMHFDCPRLSGKLQSSSERRDQTHESINVLDFLIDWTTCRNFISHVCEFLLWTKISKLIWRTLLIWIKKLKCFQINCVLTGS